MELVAQRIRESILLKQKILDSESLLEEIERCANIVGDAYERGNKVLLCGNGGSASDALHIAGELNGRFQMERKALPAIALNADVSTLTAICNDYGVKRMFSRQVESFMKAGDILIGISTSGNSANIIHAFKEAKTVGGITIGLLGRDGGTLKDLSDYIVIIPGDVTARIQESHIMVGHIICEIVESRLAGTDISENKQSSFFRQRRDN